MLGTNKTIGAIAAVVLVVSVAVLVWQNRPRSSPAFAAHDWFYDLNTGELFPGPRGAIPPIDAPSGPLPDGTPAGARAYVYGCGDCAPAHRVVAWLENYSVAQRDLLRGPDRLPRTPEEDRPYIPGPDHVPLLTGVGKLVKHPGDPAWLDASTPAGQAIMAAPRCADGTAPLECRPSS